MTVRTTEPTGIGVAAFVLGPLAARPAGRVLGAPVPHVAGCIGRLAEQ